MQLVTGSFQVSTPGWTCRVYVDDGLILPTTDRQCAAVYGRAWWTWEAWLQRAFGATLQITRLEEAPHATTR